MTDKPTIEELAELAVCRMEFFSRHPLSDTAKDRAADGLVMLVRRIVEESKPDSSQDSSSWTGWQKCLNAKDSK